MKNEPHKKTGKVSPYPGGKYICSIMLMSIKINRYLEVDVV